MGKTSKIRTKDVMKLEEIMKECQTISLIQLKQLRLDGGVHLWSSTRRTWQLTRSRMAAPEQGLCPFGEQNRNTRLQATLSSEVFLCTGGQKQLSSLKSASGCLFLPV